jgi:hypothetical protein
MKSCRTLMMLGGGLLVLGATRALAQTGQMPMGGPMTWWMVAFCILVFVVLLLSVAALVKYLFFR